MIVQWFGSQSIGGRKEQQDASLVLIGANAQSLLAVVADGAGGHAGGREAAIQVTEVARRLFHRAGGILGAPRDELTALCRESHDAINGLGANPKSAPRSTVVALYVHGDQAWWAHVGDSRIYRFRKGSLAERSRDHTMAQILLEQGEISDEQVGSHPDRIKLLKALGGEDEPKPSLGSCSIENGDKFLLCTDGFWEGLKTREIEKALNGSVTQRLLDRLVAKSARRSGPRGDNATACTIILGADSQAGVARSGLAVIGLTAIASALVADRTLRLVGKVFK
jgi:serine/threonine protein phosphatase PrpC